ncbi:methionine synthase [Corynebacterium sp. MSK218]|uniref:methionine synthase n=1 Tax=Corynebacterium sp. MSK218 TaxID=3050218 RepID=UPI00254D3E2F|nr:methionine synthase [Corynebacterium sp. MSK218]MDK8764499.1 methionine synthase [Corynebacterium sp. MSK218]
MTGFALGPMPGTSIAEAADIILGETELPAIPQLPQRGLGSDAVGRTASMLEAISIDRGPRSWRMTARPQLLTRRAWDRLERDLDEIQEVWGETVPRIKVQALGPWSLAASIELSDGHRVLSDRGAFSELAESLLYGVRAHAQDVARRFHGEVYVQLDEPLLADVIAGRIPGTTDFDTIPAVPDEVALEQLCVFEADYLHAPSLWSVARAAKTFLTDFTGLGVPEHLDGLGEHLSAGYRVGVGIPGEDARAEAISLASHLDRIGMPRELLVDSFDVYPTRANAHTLRSATETAAILTRDAGDL